MATITPATEKDIPALDKLVNSAYRGEGSKKGWTTEADLLDGLRTDPGSLLKIFQDPDAVILKYAGETSIEGCVYLKKKKDALYLGMLTVSPQLQAKGIGKQLMLQCFQSAKEMQYKKLYLESMPQFSKAVSMYEKYGFTPLDAPLGNSGHTTCNIWMIKEL